MITFGGRPLNTYTIKGGSNEPRVVDVGSELVTIIPKSNPDVVKVDRNNVIIIPKSNPDVVKVDRNNVTIIPESNNLRVVDVDDKNVTREPGLFQPRVFNVDPKKVIVTNGPGLFDPPKNKIANNPIQDLNPDDPFNPKNIDRMTKAIKDREFKNRLVVKLFGKEIVLTVEFLIWVGRALWWLMIFTIIWSICYFLHEMTQGLIDTYHKVVDGITKLMEDINNAALHLKIPGLNLKAGPFRFSTPDIIDKRFKLFGGIFDGPLREMYRASSFTRSATELIIQILIEMIKTTIESLPAILDGIANAFEKIADSI
jgi:hypothetical protein